MSNNQRLKKKNLLLQHLQVPKKGKSKPELQSWKQTRENLTI